MSLLWQFFGQPVGKSEDSSTSPAGCKDLASFQLSLHSSIIRCSVWSFDSSFNLTLMSTHLEGVMDGQMQNITTSEVKKATCTDLQVTGERLKELCGKTDFLLLCRNVLIMNDGVRSFPVQTWEQQGISHHVCGPRTTKTCWMWAEPFGGEDLG